jgi:hypothetical protein
VLDAEAANTVLSDTEADLPVKVLVLASVCAAVCMLDNAPLIEP